MPSALTNTSSDEVAGDVEGWLSLIKKAERDMDQWRDRCAKIRKRYLYEGSQTSRARMFALLWSNQEIMRPAVYAKSPSPVVQDRWRDGDPIAHNAAQLLERTIDVQFELGDFNHAFQLVRNDYLLFGRGVPRLRYEADVEEQEAPDEDAPTDDADDNQGPAKVVKAERIVLDFVHRHDFIHPSARNWRELPWVAYRSFLTKTELQKRFPDRADEIELDTDGEQDSADSDKRGASAERKATVFEIWDKVERKVLWIAKSYPGVLEKDDPYLKFEDFWPSPRPAYGTIDTESLKPVPDYTMYQDQAEEIDALTQRIAALTDSLKLVGFYPGGPEGEGSPEVERAVQPGFENRLIAVRAWDAFRKAGGNSAPIVWLPVTEVAEIIEKCVNLRKQLVDDVWQITGISDIMRGDTESDETAAAQGMKSNWGAVRLKEKQDELARVARDVTRMCAEIIAQQFQMSTLLECSNMHLPTDADVQAANLQYQQAMQQWQASQRPALPAPSGPTPQPSMPTPQIPPGNPSPAPMASGGGSLTTSQPPGAGNGGPGPAPQAPPPPPQPQKPDLGPTQEQIEGFLRNGIRRRYLVDIETDSTILLDAARVQQERTNFISEAGKFITAMLPVASEQPAALPFIGKLFLFGVRAFPAARELESSAEQLVEAMEEASKQPKPPNPEQTKLQVDMERGKIEMQKAQIGVQADMIRARAETDKAQLALEQARAEHGMKLQQLQMEGQRADQDHQLKQAEMGMKMKTLSQQVQMDERKMAASQAMDIFKDGVDRQRMTREAEAKKAEQAQLAAVPKKPRSFKIMRGKDGMAAGFEEVA